MPESRNSIQVKENGRNGSTTGSLRSRSSGSNPLLSCSLTSKRGARPCRDGSRSLTIMAVVHR